MTRCCFITRCCCILVGGLALIDTLKIKRFIQLVIEAYCFQFGILVMGSTYTFNIIMFNSTRLNKNIYYLSCAILF